MSKRIFIRGGSWFAIPNILRSVNDHRWTAESEDDDLGFRVVQDPEIRVLRGGAWINIPELLRIEVRDLDGIWINYSGFRVACDE